MAVEIIGKMKPKNNQPFALIDAVDVEMPNGKRLDEWRSGIELKETTGQMPADYMWRSLAFGGGRFVAVTGSYIAYSNNGGDWYLSEGVPEGINLQAVAYGGGKFVAVGYNPSGYDGVLSTDTTRVLYSTDGDTWKAATMPLSAQWKSVTYGGGKFVAVGVSDSKTYAAISADGVSWSWTESSVVFSHGGGCKVVYGGSLFVAISANASKSASSLDGVAWSEDGAFPQSDDGQSVSWSKIAYGNNMFVAGGYGKTVAYGQAMIIGNNHSVYWQKSTTLEIDAGCIAYGNGLFVVLPSYLENEPEGCRAAYSSDGYAWTYTDMPLIRQPQAGETGGESISWSLCAYDDEKFVAVSDDDARVAFSQDGTVWRNGTGYRLMQDGVDVAEEVKEILGVGDPVEETGIPTFDLMERGLPDVSMDGSEAGAAMETEDIIAAAESGAVKLVIGIDMYGNTIPFEVILSSLRSSAAGVCAFASAFDITGVPMTVTLMMAPERCVAYITNLAKAVTAPTSIDLSAFETAGQIVESYADGTSKTTTLEFDELGNPIKITDGDGNVTEIVW